jgi:hypothetical protein
MKQSKVSYFRTWDDAVLGSLFSTFMAALSVMTIPA